MPTVCLPMCPLLSIFKSAILIAVTVASTSLDSGPGTGHLVQVLPPRVVEAEQFDVFRLEDPGSLRLELRSDDGDADLYVSSETQQPSYSSYQLKSETCGLDWVNIEASTQRPVFIAVYGHPFYLTSQYTFSIYRVEEEIIDEYEKLSKQYHSYDSDEETSSSDDESKESGSGGKSEQGSRKVRNDVEEPLWWKLLLGLVEFGIEVIL